MRFLPLLLMLAACGADPLAVAAATVEVRASVDDTSPRTLAFEVENRGGRTVYVAACDGRIVPLVQRREHWEDETGGVFCLGIYSAVPVALRPGESVRGTAPVPGPGEFRVSVVVQDRDDGDEFRMISSRGVTFAG